jgi:hypothetical protein
MAFAAAAFQFLHGFSTNRAAAVTSTSLKTQLERVPLISKFASFVPPGGTSNRCDPLVKATGTDSLRSGGPSGAFGSNLTIVIMTM